MSGQPNQLRYLLKQRDVTHERLDGEVIAVNLLTGRYYSMSGTAADIWSSILMMQTPQGAHDLLASTYNLPASAPDEIQAFLDRCVEAELFEVEKTVTAHTTKQPQLPDDFQRTAWQTPALEEYEDLQDLILVDPIHDTSALGWPHIDEDNQATEPR